MPPLLLFRGRRWIKRLGANTGFAFAPALVLGLTLGVATARAALDTGDAVVAAGLAAWRRPDANGLACMDCHTPFAYDIAQFNFTRANVRLATTPHLPEADADAIFALIERVRAAYPPAGGLKDFRTFRPLQPGGGVIVGGENSSADVRDAAFGFQLQRTLRLAQARIATLAEARVAARELVDLDVSSVPVGLKFNHWSRSALREGALPGGRIDEWITPIAFVPKPGQAAVWRALQDAYVADPSDAALWALYQGSSHLLDLDPHNFIAGQTHGNWRWVAQGSGAPTCSSPMTNCARPAVCPRSSPPRTASARSAWPRPPSPPACRPSGRSGTTPASSKTRRSRSCPAATARRCSPTTATAPAASPASSRSTGSASPSSGSAGRWTTACASPAKAPPSAANT